MKKQLEIKGIIFDLGGVLVGAFGKAFIRNVSKELKTPPIKLNKIIQKKEANLQKGKETSLEFWKKICQELKIQCPDSRILGSLWINPYKRFAVPDKKMIMLVKRIKKNYKVAILSNTIEEHSRINKKIKLFNYFDEVLLSNEVGFRKPEKQFFQEASKRLNIPFSKLIFIDDQLRWVKAAKKIGIKSILFKSEKQLEKEFKKIGIL